MKTLSRHYKPKDCGDPDPVAIVELDASDLRAIGAVQQAHHGYVMVHGSDPAKLLSELIDRDRAALAKVINESGPARAVEAALKELARYTDAARKLVDRTRDADEEPAERKVKTP